MARAPWRAARSAIIGLTFSMSIGVLVPFQHLAHAAQPTPGHNVLAPATARTDMPRITTGEITDFAYIGDRIFIAGSFTSLRNSIGDTSTINQPYLASYNLATKLIDTNFRPVFGDGGVTEIEASPDGTKLFIAGRFNSVNGVNKRKIASIDPVTGATIASFTANADSAATAIEATNTTVYVGGQFATVNGTARVGLVALNATTGAVVPGFVNNLSGGIGTNGLLTVQALVLTHDDSKLMIVHTGRQIAGQDRYGVGMISTVTNQLLPWRTRLWDDNLQFVGGIQRAYAGAISPNDEYFVVTSGSGGDRPPISDTAVAFPISGTDRVEPLWVSRLFDSVYSVAISEVAVYIGGHFNYMESPTAPDPWPGLDDVGYGQGQGLAGYGLGDDIVIRQHIGALNPATGKALEWSPESNSFEGNKAMLIHPRGLITGGDGNIQGGATVGRVAFFDLGSVPASGANETAIINPIEGRVEESDVEFTINGTATAASGINRVQVEVHDRDSDRYLQDDLVTWGTSNTINATVASPGATSSAWTLPLTISGNNRLEVLARTFGTNGSNDASKAVKRFETFGMSDQTPSTAITGPAGTVIPTTTFVVTGTAADDVGVNAITLTFRDSNDRYLQDDGTTADTYHGFRTVPDVVGATAATWSYEVTLPYEDDEWTVQAIAVDTAGQADLRSATRAWIVSATALAPTVSISAPAVMNPPTANSPLLLAPGSPLTFSGSAIDDQGLDYVQISLRNTTTRENLAADGTWSTNAIQGYYRVSPLTSLPGSSYNWTYTTPFNLRPGTYSFTVRAVDDLGLATASANQGRLTINVQVPGDAFPDGTLNVTGTQTGLQVLHLDLAGTATDDLGVSSVKVSVQERDTSRYVQSDGTLAVAYSLLDATLANPGAASTTWTLPLDLPDEGDYSVTAYAYDTSDQQDPSTTGATARYPIYPGDLPPYFVNDFSPTEGTVFVDAKIFVSGRLEDDRQMADAQIAIINSAGQYLSSTGTFTSTTASWRTAFLNSVGTPGSNFSYTTPAIPSGDYTVLARGVDNNGFITAVPNERHVTVTAPAGNFAPVAAFTVNCTDNICAFDGRTSTDENAPTLTYAWSFGQGSGTGSVPTKTYTAAGTYTAALTVRDEYGLTGTVSQVVTIVEPPSNTAPIPVINPPSCSMLVCNISAVGSTDSNVGDTITYLWNFGDGTATSTSSAPSHSFPAAGTYTMSLTATDGWLRTATITRDITVSGTVVIPTNLSPTASFAVPSCTFLQCSYASSATDSDGTIATHSWNFGDGQSAIGQTTSHIYTAPGTYAVVLTVTDDDGAQATTNRTVTVVAAVNAPPVASFISTCVELTCTVDATGTDADGSIVGWSWNFGDATVAEPGLEAQHTYAAAGAYQVTLTVTDDDGAQGSITQQLDVAGPDGTFVPDAPSVPSPQIAPTQVGLAWQPPADDGGTPVIDYIVQYSSNGGASWTTFGDATPSIATSVVVTGLTNGNTYVFRIAAVNDTGTSPFGAISVGVTPVALPAEAALIALPPTLPIADSTPAIGQQIVVAMSGFEPFEWVAIVVQSTPTLIGSVQADADGAIDTTVVVPMLAPGAHTLSAYGLTSGSGARASIQVVATDDGVAAPTGAGFVAVAPTRLFDTRPGEAQGVIAVTKQQYGGVRELRIDIAGVAGVPETGAGSVSLNVTATGADAAGFVTVYPCGQRPTASNLNYIAGQTIANAVIAPLSAAGEICLFSSADTHLLADINGWFASGAGFAPVAPTRLFDTRPGEAQGAIPVTKQQYGGVQELRIDLAGVAGVPKTGAGAVSLNVTVTDPGASGFVTVYPCGQRPTASNLNYIAGQTIPNAVIAPLSAAGEICLFSSADTHLLADINGWFASGAGFAPVAPIRLFDTRPGEAQGAIPVTKQQYGGVRELRLDLDGVAGVPATGASAVSLNVTVTGSTGAGYVTVYPCGQRPTASNLNYIAGQTIPNAVIAPVSAAGEICLFSSADSHLVADINGWFAAT
jgi:PKD repeat protein